MADKTDSISRDEYGPKGVWRNLGRSKGEKKLPKWARKRLRDLRVCLESHDADLESITRRSREHWLTPGEASLAEKLRSLHDDFAALSMRDGGFHRSDMAQIGFHVHALQNFLYTQVASRIPQTGARPIGGPRP